ncbi:zinc finger protein 366-like [Culicoides brevitarsis]|uniref:zinc finger protein 366-like n=1 Tax=Culicoides brevitarsis TaxID=469753 RepID=UPI00307BD2A5
MSKEINESEMIEIIDFVDDFNDENISKETEQLLTTFFTNVDDDSFFEGLDDTAETEYTCPLCQEIFLGKRAMRTHVSRYFKHICETCDKRYFRAKYLQTHLKNAHLPSKNLECPLCDKVFKAVNNLKQHLLLHSEARSFVCTFDGCDKAFKQKPGLQQHIRFMHNPNANFCRVCRKRVTNLEKHNENEHPNGTSSKRKKKTKKRAETKVLQESNQDDDTEYYYEQPTSKDSKENQTIKRRSTNTTAKVGPAKKLKMSSDEASDDDDELSATWKFDSDDENFKEQANEYAYVVLG